MSVQRVTVRANTYRGVAGWLVTAGPRFRVWFDHEAAARRTAQRRRDDPTYEVTLIDFEP